MGNASSAAQSLAGVRAAPRGRLAALFAVPALAALSAVLISLALPPADVSLCAWVCLVPLLLAIRSCRTAIGSALCSTVFVLLFGTLFARWLPGTITAFFGLSPVAAWVSALTVYAAFGFLPIGLSAVLAHRLLRRRGWLAILAGVPALWVAAELFRVHLLGGLPWALLGHALYRQPTLIQIADLAGVFGVSFMIAAVNVGVLLAIRGPSGGRGTVIPLTIALGLVGAAWLYGNVRLRDMTRQAGNRPTIAVGVLQPNRPPVYRWSRVAADRALISYFGLTRRHLAGQDLDLIIWPENAIPLYPERDGQLQARLARFTEALGAPLIFGAPGIGGDSDASGSFNAAHLILPTAGLAGTYRKQRLVPFAEYPPLAKKLAADGPARVFLSGNSPVVFDVDGVRWGPTICLDFVFAHVVRATVRAGAEVFVNLSNDSWLAAGGSGAAQQQHAQAVFRAVENRRDVVRATTTGISAAVAATGIPQAVLDEGQAGALVAHVTPRQTVTFYTIWGDAFGVSCALLSIVIFVCDRGMCGWIAGMWRPHTQA
jgi:apolipoprotein N-acyltransferase